MLTLMKKYLAVTAALLMTAFTASAGGVHFGVGVGLGCGFGFRVGFGVGFPGCYSGYSSYCGYGYSPRPYYGNYGYYAPAYAAYPAYPAYASYPAVTYAAPAAPAAPAAQAAPAQTPVVINNYNYYGSAPSGANALFGR